MAPAAATAVAAKPAKPHKPLPAPNSDFYEVYETLTAEELATVKRVRASMEAKVAPKLSYEDVAPWNPQLQNRLQVETQWLWSYFTGQRGSRVISEAPRTVAD